MPYPAGTSYVTLSGVYANGDAFLLPAPDFISGPTLTVNSNGWARQIGTLKNNSPFNYSYMYIEGVLYNSTGQVIGCSIDSLSGSPSTALGPGQTFNFIVDYTGTPANLGSIAASEIRLGAYP